MGHHQETEDDWSYDEAEEGHGHFAKLEQVAEKARESLSWLDERVRQLVTHHPLPAILATVGIGFVIGRLVARR